MRRGDAWVQALQCYSELADEVIVIDGSKHETFKQLPKNVKMVKSLWEDEFSWEFIGQQFQKGYENCTGDWVIHADLDFIFHETDFGLIRRTFEDNMEEPALSFWKYQFILPDRYNLKSRLVIAVNKGKYGGRIKFDSGGDLCQPSLDGREIDAGTTKEARIPFYNYEKILKTYDQIVDDCGRMARAWERHFGNTKLGGDTEEAFNEWATMIKGRFAKPQQRIDLFRHPQFMIPLILDLKPIHFGYDGLTMLEVNDYVGGDDVKNSLGIG